MKEKRRKSQHDHQRVAVEEVRLGLRGSGGRGRELQLLPGLGQHQEGPRARDDIRHKRIQLIQDDDPGS